MYAKAKAEAEVTLAKLSTETMMTTTQQQTTMDIMMAREEEVATLSTHVQDIHLLYEASSANIRHHAVSSLVMDQHLKVNYHPKKRNF